jgi:hypothetical protein
MAMTNLRWTGVFRAATTQLREDQSLDLTATARCFDGLIDSGIFGFKIRQAMIHKAVNAEVTKGLTRRP